MKITPISTSPMNSIATDIQGITAALRGPLDSEITALAVSNLQALSEQVDALLSVPLYTEMANHKKQMLFLACPYTAESKEERDFNLAVSQAAAIFLMKKGFDVYNPLSHGSGIIIHADKEFEENYTPYFNWHEMNCRIMECCDAFVWLDDPIRTPKSNGMLAEVKHAILLGLPIIGMKQGKTIIDFEIYGKASEKQSPFPVTATIN